MDKKIIALIILVVVIVGGYGSFYAFEKTFMVPDDLSVFKEELNSLNSNAITEKDISEIETQANQIQNTPSLKILSAAERKKLADDMRNDLSFVSMNSHVEELKDNITQNREIASRYDLLLMGDIANDMRNIYSAEYESLIDKTVQIIQKMPTDMENGDNLALANDMRELAKNIRKISKLDTDAKNRLEKIISRLES